MHAGTDLALAALLFLAQVPPLAEDAKMNSAAKEEQGLPVPAGAVKNLSLGGATTLAPGKNYTIIVYEINAPITAVAAFYKDRMPDAMRTEEEKEIRLSTREGTIRLAPLGAGTRITLVIGPR